MTAPWQWIATATAAKAAPEAAGLPEVGVESRHPLH